MGLNCLTCCGGELLVGLDKHHRLSESQELELFGLPACGRRHVWGLLLGSRVVQPRIWNTVVTLVTIA